MEHKKFKHVYIACINILNKWIQGQMILYVTCICVHNHFLQTQHYLAFTDMENRFK